MNSSDFNKILRWLPNIGGVEHRFGKDEVVFEQGAPCGGLWLVRRGRVDLQRVTETGHLVLIHRALEAESFAEASLFSSHYHCTARAAHADTHLFEIGRESLHEAMRDDSKFSMDLCAMLAHQVQSYRRQVEVLSIKKAEERVFEAAAHGMLGDDIKAFAARIALSHEVVYRALAQLAKKGRLVKVARGRYQVPGSQ